MLNLQQKPKWNLEPILVKCLDPEEGYGWELDFALDIAEEYRKYCQLCLIYPNEPLVPSSLIDDFWHLHILDTLKYVEDCENYFGYFLHHFPYFGMRGKEDEDNLKRAWLSTLDLYAKHFGNVPTDLWPSSKRCPNCGVRCRSKYNDALFEKRPTLADIFGKN